LIDFSKPLGDWRRFPDIQNIADDQWQILKFQPRKGRGQTARARFSYRLV
jgi:hypothetical protein